MLNLFFQNMASESNHITNFGEMAKLVCISVRSCEA